MPAVPPRLTSAQPSLLTVAEFAAAVRVSQRAVRRWISEERLPTLRFGRAVRIRQADVDRILQTGLPQSTG